MDEKIHLTLFDLTLDNNRKEYQAGDKVSGIIKMRLNGRLHLNNLKINLECIAEVKWVENPGTRYHKEGHIYHDRTKLLENTYAVPDQFDDSILKAGEYEIPFQFKLPEKDIPSSFKSPHGSVTYYVEGLINELAIDEVHRVGTEIVVDAPIRENLKLSVGSSVEKDFGLLSCGSGKMVLHASLPKKGYHPGEIIELHTMVENDSSVEATPRATLHQRQIYMCGERHKAFDDCLSPTIIGKTVGKNTDFTDILSIRVPKDVSLTIKSGMVNIKYFIHLTLDIPHSIDIHLDIPIIVTNMYVLSEN